MGWRSRCFARFAAEARASDCWAKARLAESRGVRLRADSLDDPDDPGLDRLQQLLLPLLIAGLHIGLALLQALLHGLEVALLRLFRGRGEGERLLVEGAHRRIPLLLHLLQRVADALALFAERSEERRVGK